MSKIQLLLRVESETEKAAVIIRGLTLSRTQCSEALKHLTNASCALQSLERLLAGCAAPEIGESRKDYSREIAESKKPDLSKPPIITRRDFEESERAELLREEQTKRKNENDNCD